MRTPASRFRSRQSCLLGCLSLFLLHGAACSPAYAAEVDAIVPPDVPVAGMSQSEWSREWWQWAASFDGNDSPVADRTGARCGLRQTGAVWFLAGTYGTKRTIRRCTLPRGKYVFFPLINYVVFPDEDDPDRDCASLKRSARLMTDGVTSLVLDLDGRRATGLKAHRQATVQCFDLGAKTGSDEQPLPAAANGYYVMLKPLQPGTYELNFGGILPSMVQAVTYTLVVE